MVNDVVLSISPNFPFFDGSHQTSLAAFSNSNTRVMKKITDTDRVPYKMYIPSKETNYLLVLVKLEKHPYMPDPVIKDVSLITQ